VQLFLGSGNSKSTTAVNILVAPQNLFRCTQKLNYYCENLARDTGDKGDRASIQFRETAKGQRTVNILIAMQNSTDELKN
jgi:hypothetical protein